MKQGSLSINSENIFPIIKKWLYSDHDIFFRELISNGCDAVTKLKKLELMGEFEAPEDNKYRVDVVVSPEDKIIKIIDNGIGMTGEEVEEYITQIAFSGAEAFLENYKDKTDNDQIIGHFGLGFYSAFMVAERVTIDTLSYKDGAQAVFWECDGGTEYTMENSDRTARGTEITLYLNEDSFEFANEWRAREVIEKYCSFMPVDIFFTNEDTKEEEAKEDIPEVIDAEDASEENSADIEEKEESVETPINDPHPLWTKHPNECTEEEYRSFYHKVFMDYKEPLFWIHLNMDYPFNLKGILYFPKITNQYESIEGTIKLYNNQVFIADNIKEVIPEFLLLLKGVIDCPDLPLNVSRSALQNDGFVKKISDYITKKVADKLSGMCKTDKENYEKYWDDISPFIKFGCLKDDKFNKKMNDYILFKNLEGKYLTLPEYLEAGKEKYENKVFYVTDETVQSQYIQMFKEEGMDAVLMLHNIDSAFINHLEMKNDGVKFLRIDADLSDNFKEETGEDELKETESALSDLFKKVLNNDKLNVKVEKLKNADTSSIITLSEEARRMDDMMKFYAANGGMEGMNIPVESTLILNTCSPLIKKMSDEAESEKAKIIAHQVYMLALLAQRQLTADELQTFLSDSFKLLENSIN